MHNVFFSEKNSSGEYFIGWNSIGTFYVFEPDGNVQSLGREKSLEAYMCGLFFMRKLDQGIPEQILRKDEFHRSEIRKMAKETVEKIISPGREKAIASWKNHYPPAA